MTEEPSEESVGADDDVDADDVETVDTDGDGGGVADDVETVDTDGDGGGIADDVETVDAAGDCGGVADDVETVDADDAEWTEPDDDVGNGDDLDFSVADAEPTVDPANVVVTDDELTATPDGGEITTDAVLPDEASVPDSDDDEVEPVEVLVNLAQDGEIDPWDIDVVEVTDAFLARLDETDLRTSGRALFYSSVLLRMKSDAMLAEEPDEDEDELEPWEAAMRGDDTAPVDNGHDPVDALEAEMDRRLERKSTRGSPETLDELVRELREAERDSWWKANRTYDTSGGPTGFQRGTQEVDYRTGDDRREEGEPTEAEVTGNTHQEDIEEVIEAVRDRLREHFERDRDEVLFVEVRDAGGDPMMTFLALLFLAHGGAVRLDQDELFGDLWVAPTDQFEVATVSPEVAQ